MANTAILLLIILLIMSIPVNAATTDRPLVGQKGVYSVTTFGAKGDGKTDDTAAFQKALVAAGKVGGGIVFVPTGNYLIKTHIELPEAVTLEGVFKAPTARTANKGSTLLAVEGRGKDSGNPFIFLRSDSCVKGITVLYPEQDKKNPVPYPWCIGGAGDNCSIIDVLLVNPWQAVDFGTAPCGRHLIRGLYAQPLHKGIFVDKCFDVGRIEDVHLWPFWLANEDMQKFQTSQATAFIFGRTDWEYVSNCFAIWYKVGFQFTEFKDGPGNVILSTSGSDIGPTAVLVESSQGHAGIVFTNCQFMTHIEVKETNTGPVKFNNCGYWGIPGTKTHATIRGGGHVFFNECHFNGWDQAGEGEPCIFADGNGLTVSGCDFMDEGKKQIVLGPNSKASVIMGNRLRGGAKIENQGKGKPEIGLNVEE